MSLIRNENESNTEKFRPGYMFNKRYRLQKELGAGGQGRVFIVEDTNKAAHSQSLKVVKLVENIEHGDVKNELNLLKKLVDKSKYIIRYYDDFPFYMIKHCIVTEYCHKDDLAKHLMHYKSIDIRIRSDKVNFWNRNIVEGLCFLHENKIIHRDIKPQNIFVTESDNLKIGDLGYSKLADNMVTSSRTVGTLNYMSPEILKREKYDEKIDTWGYGCVLYEMIFLEQLFQCTHELALLKEIEENQLQIPKTRNVLREILNRCLEKNMVNRASMAEVKQIIDDYERIRDAEETRTNMPRKLRPNCKIASGSYDKTIRVWDVDTGECLQTLQGHENPVWCVAAVDSRQIVSGSGDRTLRLWDIEEAICTKILTGHKEAIICMTIMHDNRLATGSDDRTIKLWNLETGKCEKTLVGHRATVVCLTVLDLHRIISGSYDKKIKVWNVHDDSYVNLTGHENTVRCLTVINMRIIASGSDDDTIKMWNVDSGECIGTLEGHSGPVYCLTLLDRSTIMSGSDDRTIKVWDMDSRRCKNTLTGHDSTVVCLATIDQSRVTSGSNDDTIKVWNVADGVCTNTFKKHKDIVTCLTVINQATINHQNII